MDNNMYCLANNCKNNEGDKCTRPEILINSIGYCEDREILDLHQSDCATHNKPAYPKGKCNCSVSTPAIAIGEDTYEECRVCPKECGGCPYANTCTKYKDTDRDKYRV